MKYFLTAILLAALALWSVPTPNTPWGWAQAVATVLVIMVCLGLMLYGAKRLVEYADGDKDA